jgi:hypothetical protein
MEKIRIRIRDKHPGSAIVIGRRARTKYFSKFNCWFLPYSNMAALEKGVMDNIFVDFRRKGSHYECTTVSSIREISRQVGEFFTDAMCNLSIREFSR